MLSLNPEDFQQEVARLFAQPKEMPTNLAEAQSYYGSWDTSRKSTFNQMDKTKNKNKHVEKDDAVTEQINFHYPAINLIIIKKVKVKKKFE